MEGYINKPKTRSHYYQILPKSIPLYRTWYWHGSNFLWSIWKNSWNRLCSNFLWCKGSYAKHYTFSLSFQMNVCIYTLTSHSKHRCNDENPGKTGLDNFRSAQKTTNLIEGFEDLLPIKFRQNPFSGCGEEVEKCFSLSEVRAAILDFWSARKTQTW